MSEWAKAWLWNWQICWTSKHR